MDEKTWRIIDERFRKHPKARASAVDVSEFERVMGGVSRPIDPDYREFVLRYGGGLMALCLSMVCEMPSLWAPSAEKPLRRK